MSSLISAFSERAERKRASNAYIGDSDSLRLRYFSSFFKADAPTYASGVDSPTLQNVGVHQHADDDGAVEERHKYVRVYDVLVFMHYAVCRPEQVDDDEEKPRR